MTKTQNSNQGQNAGPSRFSLSAESQQALEFGFVTSFGFEELALLWSAACKAFRRRGGKQETPQTTLDLHRILPGQRTDPRCD